MENSKGMQYASLGYTALLQAAQVQISMAARDRPTENAFAECFTRTLKEEKVFLNEYENLAYARTHLTHFWIRSINTRGFIPPQGIWLLLSLKLTGLLVLVKHRAHNIYRFIGPLHRL